MKKPIKWKAIVMGLMLAISYCIPMQVVQATETTNKSMEVTALEGVTATITGQSESKLQPGDDFSINVTVQINRVIHKDGNGEMLFFTDATVSGAVSEESKPYLKALTSDVVGGTGTYEFSISGLVYSGYGDTISASINISSKQDTLYTATTKSYTLSAYDSHELQDVLVVEKQDNLLVKTNGTQNVSVKITNKGKFTINQADVSLSLNSKVEGLKIKTDKTQIQNIKSKEVKNAIFTIVVDEETKAGVYPATITVLGNTYSINIQVDSNVVPSALEVCLTDSSSFTPGVEKSANILVKNVGERDAKNIRVELVNTENVAVVENSNVKRLDILQAHSNQNILMKVRINSDFKGESVAIPIKVNYLSSTGEAAEDTQYIYLYTTNTKAPAEVHISNIISPTGTFEVDENFTVKFNVSAQSAAENIQVSVEGDEGIVPKSQNLFFVNKLTTGESKQYSVTFAATRAAVSSSHPIKITVTYGKSDTPTTINQYGSVNIKNSKKDKEENKDEVIKGKPKVIIGEYTIEPTIVKAGEKFVLTIGFLNTNDEHSVHNLKANILPVQQEKADEDNGNVFTPVEGSNTLYIADLMPQETATKVLHLYTIPSATAKTYQITVDMAYEDEEGNEITAQESLGIPVEQMTKIEVGDINLSPGILGEAIPVSVSFYNRGRTKVNNMMVYLEGEGFSVEDNKTFIGTFDIGASETYEPMIIPETAGMLTGTLVVEYEDPSGETVIEKKPFDIEVEEMMMEEPVMDEMMMEEEEEKANPLPIIIAIVLGCVVLATAIVIIKKKRKAKKEEMMLDEED